MIFDLTYRVKTIIVSELLIPADTDILPVFADLTNVTSTILYPS
jgi:hypothetical protein